MNRPPDLFDKQIYYRLIALWVLCEAVLGGILHATHLPFTGILVAGSAVICICLIAYYVPVKGAILRATIIVAIFKLMLSPHAGPSAYLALLFQGLAGQLVFFNLKFYSISCVLLGMLALVESAVQRIVVLTILYGTEFWKAVDEFIHKITGDSVLNNYSVMVAVGYIIIHAIAGLLVGSFAASIVWQSQSWSIFHEEYLIPEDEFEEKEIRQQRKRRKTKVKTIFLVIWIMLILLFVQSYFKIGAPLMPSQIVIQILLRSVLILLTWYFLLSPVLLYFIKKWLRNKQAQSQSDINEVVMILPSARHIFVKSWQISGKEKGFKRITECCKIVLVNTLKRNDHDEIVI